MEWISNPQQGFRTMTVTHFPTVFFDRLWQMNVHFHTQISSAKFQRNLT